MAWLRKAAPAGATQPKRTPTLAAVNRDKFKPLLTQIAYTWAASLVLAAFHILLGMKSVGIKCEIEVAYFNARCAGALLVFGCCQSLAATLVSPLNVLHALLHRNAEVVRRGTCPLSVAVAFGSVLSLTVLLVMPLHGFYICLGAASCKQNSTSHYVCTVALSCADCFVTCAAFWAMVRGRDPTAIVQTRKPELKRSKLKAQTPKQQGKTT